MRAFDNPALVVALAMLVGVLAQAVAARLFVPGIVVLLGAGVLLGPDTFDVIRPQTMGTALEAVVGFSVAVILFDGGLNLNLRVLRLQEKAIRRLVTIGAVVTAVGGMLAARLFLGWSWRTSFLFGTLVIVTGPTVITPLLRRINVRQSVESILEAEGIFIDAVGATIAVVALEVTLAPADERFGAAATGVGLRFAIGAALGAVGGALLAVLLRIRKALPEGLANVTALALAVALFQVSNALVADSGITAVIVAGVLVGNFRGLALEGLREFKEQLTVLLIGTLFVLLAADVRLATVRALGWPGVLTVLALIVVVRPANVFVSTWGTGLSLREKLFLSWLAPRGIVAAAVASLFAERLIDAGHGGGRDMRALVFLVIGTTVVLQGLSGGVVAKLLGLRLPRDVGFAILGANEIARRLAASLREAGEEVVFIDSNAASVMAAEQDGFKVVFGNGLDERALLKARVETRRACLGLTPNESVNYLFASKVRERTKAPKTFAAIEQSATSGVTDRMMDDLDGAVLFLGARDVPQWNQLALRRQVETETWRLDDPAEDEGPTFADLPAGAALPLTCLRGSRVAPVERRYRGRRGDVVELAVATDRAEIAREWLRAHGFVLELPTSTRDGSRTSVA
jgi:NhaP-type Na+/H+ or K+/H+ antiporter